MAKQERKELEIKINEIENGYIVTFDNRETFYADDEEALTTYISNAINSWVNKPLQQKPPAKPPNPTKRPIYTPF